VIVRMAFFWFSQAPTTVPLHKMQSRECEKLNFDLPKIKF
jgi:hypothetical protein